jgi:predicted transcriptional regulator
MKKYMLIATSLLLSLTYACKESAKTEKPSQMQHVIAVHDEVMPKMGTIGKLIGQLEDKIKQTDNPEALIEARTDLREANKAMMDWMKGFGDSFEGDEIMKGKALTEEKQKILDLEEKKVEALRDQINNSIKNAEEVLK